MNNEIKAAIIGSIITGILGFIAIKSMGVLEAELKDDQIFQVASNIINTESYRDVLLKKMALQRN